MMQKPISLLSILLCILCSAQAQRKQIKVIDESTNQSISFFSVSIAHREAILIGNSEGLTSFNIQEYYHAPTDSFLVSCVGYQPYGFTFKAISSFLGDTFVVRLRPVIHELPEVTLAKVDLSKLLEAALEHSFNKYLPSQEASVFYRIARQNGSTYTGLFEGVGKRYETGLSLQMFVGSRVSHTCKYLTEVRSTGFNAEEAEKTYYPNMGENFTFLNYFLRYVFPFSHQLYKKKINRSFKGEEDILVIDLEPDLSNRELVRAGNKVSLKYGNIFKSKRRYFINLNDTTISAISIVQESVGEVGWFQKFMLNRSEMEFRFRKQGDYLVLTYAGEKRNVAAVKNKDIQFVEISEAYFLDVQQKQYSDEELKKKYYLTIMEGKGMLKQFGSSNYSKERRFCGATPVQLTENASFWKSYNPPSFNYQQLRKDLLNHPYLSLFE